MSVTNELDQLIEVKQLGEGTDVNDHHEANRLTVYKRNLLGQVTSVTDALGQTERYKYNPLGQLIEKMDKDGYLTTYGYTSQGDVNHIKYGDGKEVQMSYNPLRQLTEITDWLGVTSIEIDALGRATKVTNHNDEMIDYSYGKLGERRSITYPDGKQVSYHYDEALRLASIVDGTDITRYHYDDYSRLIQKQYPNETATDYQFNELGQLQTLIHSQSGKDTYGRSTKKTLDQFHYEYDLLGNKIEVNRIRGDASGIGNLPESGRYKYRYDALNRLTRVMRERDTLRRYQYDAFGNRKSLLEFGKTIAYTYNSLNQLISRHDEQGEHEYLYDARGNLKTISRNDEVVQEYFFGELNRLEKAHNHENGMFATYDYNGLGNRVSQTMLDSETFDKVRQIDDVIDLTKPYHNLLQRSEVPIVGGFLEPNHESAKTSTFTYDFGVLSVKNEDEILHYLQDDLGSPVRLLDDHGNQRNVFDFDEFGNSLLPNSNNQPFGFTGYQHCGISDLLLSPSRAYSTKMGRFTSEDTHWHTGNMIYGDHQSYTEVPMFLRGMIPDTLAMGQANNLYGYTMNSPVNYNDPAGEAIVTSILVGVAVGTLVGGGFNVASQVNSEIQWSGVFNDTFNGDFNSAWGGFSNGVQQGWNNISWKEVGVNAFYGGIAGGLGGASGLIHPAWIMGGNGAINGAKYTTVQVVNGENIRLGDLFFEVGTGLVGGIITVNTFSEMVIQTNYIGGRAVYQLVPAHIDLIASTFLRESWNALKDEARDWSWGEGYERIKGWFSGEIEFEEGLTCPVD